MISFFTQPERNDSVHIGRLIRGIQIADALNSKINPQNNYENDTCIYVMRRPPNTHPQKTYWDMNDHYIPQDFEWLKEHDEVKLIAVSKSAQQFMAKATKRKEENIQIIPHHHCNFDQEIRNKCKITTIGTIGGARSIEFNTHILQEKLTNMGLRFLQIIHPLNREQVINFYKKIDIQIIYRPRRAKSIGGKLGSSLKLANACSFGIPTICYPEVPFVDEFNDCFIPIYSINDLLNQIEILTKNNNLYQTLSTCGIERAKAYHIFEIVKFYKNL